jgi:DNA-directed RNA polymerase specialized sigma24 family protein
MGEDRESPREVLRRELVKDGVAKRLLGLAAWLTRNPADAEDLLQSALAVAADANGWPWDPDGDKPFTMHIGAIMINRASNDRRRSSIGRVVLDPDVATGERVAGDGHSPDQDVDDLRQLAWVRRIKSTLAASLDANDHEAAAVYRAILEGVEGHAAIAAHTGCPPEAVRLAYDRITYQGRRIVKLEEEKDLLEMRQRRESAAPRRETEAAR